MSQVSAAAPPPKKNKKPYQARNASGTRDRSTAAVLVREDFFRLYVDLLYPDPIKAPRAALLGPLLHFKSLYVGSVRYQGAWSSSVLCIRDGGFGKFYATIRGRFWQAALVQIAHLLPRRLVWSTGSTPYGKMAEHALAIFFPSAVYGKLLLKDYFPN